MHTKSFSLKTSEIERKFILIDCNQDGEPLVLGRMATEVAKILKGKHKPTYTTHMLCGDQVVIINGNKIHVTGNKKEQKLYRKHTGYFGGLKVKTYKDMKYKDIIEKAIKGMLRKGPQRNAMIKSLYIYEDENHLQVAQKPVLYTITR
jgi:large subunit ribosomal protein L13